jgi:hypothetical protein
MFSDGTCHKVQTNSYCQHKINFQDFIAALIDILTRLLHLVHFAFNPCAPGRSTNRIDEQGQVLAMISNHPLIVLQFGKLCWYRRMAGPWFSIILDAEEQAHVMLLKWWSLQINGTRRDNHIEEGCHLSLVLLADKVRSFSIKNSIVKILML